MNTGIAKELKKRVMAAMFSDEVIAANRELILKDPRFIKAYKDAKKKYKKAKS